MIKHKVTIAEAMQCHPLAPAVLRQLGGGKDAVESAMDAANHGANAGFHGFIYSRDLIPFAKRHRQAIADAIAGIADDLGEDAGEMVRSFGSLQGFTVRPLTVWAALTGGSAPDTEGIDAVLGAMAWFALEEVGRAIVALSER